MKSRVIVAIVFVLIVCCRPPRVNADSALWNTGYYAGWMQDYLPPSEIDFSALTHVIHFAAIPNADGSLDTATNVLTAAYSADLVSHAHAAGVPALVSIGGEGSASAFRGAASSANLSRLISNVVDLMTSRGYDGVDVDWEPLAATDATEFSALIHGLRAALGAAPLLTVPVASQPALIATLQGDLDQVNLMTYTLSGPWSGWVTWHNSPLYDGGYRFPSTGGLVPSTDGMLNSFLTAGVAPSKLGIGVTFYGYQWSGGAGTPTGGATAPRQGWSTAPTTLQLPYYSIMDNYSRSYQYVWDDAAKAGYYFTDQSGSTNDNFISFDDEPALDEKVQYAKAMGIGGVMIWELGGGYRSNQPAGYRDPLLQALKTALGAGSPNPTPTSPPTPTPTPTPSSCSVSISPTQQVFGRKGGSSSVSVSAPSGCAWTASSSASWISFTSGPSGIGNGRVTYSVPANTDLAPRSGTISVADDTVSISQSAGR